MLSSAGHASSCSMSHWLAPAGQLPRGLAGPALLVAAPAERLTDGECDSLLFVGLLNGSLGATVTRIQSCLRAGRLRDGGKNGGCQ